MQYRVVVPCFLHRTDRTSRARDVRAGGRRNEKNRNVSARSKQAIGTRCQVRGTPGFMSRQTMSLSVNINSFRVMVYGYVILEQILQHKSVKSTGRAAHPSLPGIDSSIKVII